MLLNCIINKGLRLIKLCIMSVNYKLTTLLLIYYVRVNVVFEMWPADDIAICDVRAPNIRIWHNNFATFLR